MTGKQTADGSRIKADYHSVFPPPNVGEVIMALAGLYIAIDK